MECASISIFPVIHSTYLDGNSLALLAGRKSKGADSGAIFPDLKTMISLPPTSE
jgi:hypothetical protein